MTKRIVYVVDDEEPIRRSSQLMLRTQGYDVFPFDGGVAFLAALASLRPGCVLLDIRMPELDGLEVQQRAAQAGADLPIVIMSGHGDLSVAVQAMQNGAIAFVEKPFARAILQPALQLAFLKLEEPERYAAYLAASREKVAALEPTERAVLAQLARGRSNEMIASELGLGTAKIEMARARLFSATGIESTTDALRLAFAAGMGAVESD
jgi:two-component system, LuxR family, response regulator FixJ